MSDRLIGDVCLQCGKALYAGNRLHDDNGDPLPWAICGACAEDIAQAVRVAKRQWYGE